VQNLATLALAVLEISLGAAKFKMDHVTLTTPLLRVICHRGLALTIGYIHNYTYIHAFIPTHGKKANIKLENVAINDVLPLKAAYKSADILCRGRPNYRSTR